MKREILVVDDEPDIRSMVRMLLEDEGYSVREASNAEEARRALSVKPPALIILDIWMRHSDMDGLELQKWVKRQYPDVPTIMISGHGNIETAVQAMKDGAFDFVEKPFKSDQLLLLIERALASAARDAEHDELKRRNDLSLEQVGHSAAMVGIRQMVAKVAPTNSRILLTGPPGSGKELLARNIHSLSSRCAGRFVAVNCSQLSPGSALASLFGTEQGDGGHRVVGLLEQAHGGTLYLEEICDLSPELQGRLVRLLQDWRFRRLGGSAEVEVDIRVISSSSRNIKAAVEEGQFREDLFHRLSVVPIAVPALSRRREDIAELARCFLENRLRLEGGRSLAFTSKALALLEAYSWPGNITQLRNMVDWIVIMTDRSKQKIGPEDLPAGIGGEKVDGEHGGDSTALMVAMSLKEAREHFEKQYLLSQLSRFNGNISRTASAIGMERSALHRKLKHLGIQMDSEERPED